VGGALLSVLAVGGVGGTPAFAGGGWTWPVRGAVVTGYANAGGPYTTGNHRGIDVAAAIGTPVVAAAGGTVRFAGVVGSSGLTVSVRTADGRFDTSYLHLAETSARTGEVVGPGERIGTAGTSGRPSTPTPHLHFGVRDAGTRSYRDPLDLLSPRPGVRELPRGAPVALRGPVRVGPAPQPVRGRAPERAPVPAGSPSPWRTPATATFWRPVVATPHRVRVAAPSRLPWAIACAALICAAAMLGWRSSIDPRAVLRHNADLLRQR
jgi:murein DD-endopeptidase MepM/ murein hydrolase activator NlpD